MFENVGSKIKGVAQAGFLLEAIGAVIAGISLMAADEDLIWAGVLVLAFGPIAALVVSWFIYGYGQLIENSDLATEALKQKAEKQQQTIAQNAERKQQQRRNEARAKLSDANVDKDDFIDFACPHCRSELSFSKEYLQGGKPVLCPMCDGVITIEEG